MDLYLQETQKLMRNVIVNNADDGLKEMLEYHFETWGKMNRPKATALIATSLNVQPLSTLGWAAGLEMFHNGTLIHDDLQDGDVLRRSRESVWKKFSPNMAINAGDFLMINANECILMGQLGESKRIELARLFNKMASEVVDGQCREFQLSELDSEKALSQRYLECAGMKTASLYGKLARGVGIIGDLEESELEDLEDVFFKLGLLTQMQDDIIDLYGDKKRDMQGNDIKEGKVSFLIVKHLEEYNYNFDAIKKLLTRHRDNILRGEILIMKEQFMRDGTLSRALSELLDRSHALMKHEYLNKRPELQNIMSIFLGQLLKPLDELGETVLNINQSMSKLLVGHGSETSL